MRRLLLGLLVGTGCGDNHALQSDARLDGPGLDAHEFHDARVYLDAPLDAGPRGPAAFQLPGTGNSVYWDAAASALYLTDDTHDQLVKWTDAAGFQTFGTFPAGSAGIALGTIVKLADNSFLVPSNGFATQGTIFTMTSDGTASGSVTGLDATRRRTGLGQDANGLLYEAYYTGATGAGTGGTASVVITTNVGVETAAVTTGLSKVIGIVATTTTVNVCDQTVNKIFAIAIPANTISTLATPPSCDQISRQPNGDLVTGGLTGGVYRITSAGVVSTIASGFEQVRGTAYDNVMHRMFVIEHSVVPGGHDRLHVIPVDN
jgi:hypothetical protein